MSTDGERVVTVDFAPYSLFFTNIEDDAFRRELEFLTSVYGSSINAFGLALVLLDKPPEQELSNETIVMMEEFYSFLVRFKSTFDIYGETEEYLSFVGAAERLLSKAKTRVDGGPRPGAVFFKDKQVDVTRFETALADISDQDEKAETLLLLTLYSGIVDAVGEAMMTFKTAKASGVSGPGYRILRKFLQDMHLIGQHLESRGGSEEFTQILSACSGKFDEQVIKQKTMKRANRKDRPKKEKPA